MIMKISIYVKKNNGTKQKFDFTKLKRSIEDALKHINKRNGELAERMSRETMEYLEGSGKKLIESDTIRQAVIHVLKHHNESEASDSYQMTSLRIPHLKIHKVAKRGGGEETFHAFKLFKAIKKSFLDAGIEPNKLPEEITKEVIKKLEPEYENEILPIEIIRKTTAALLKEKKLGRVEKSYLLHKYL